MTAWTRGLIAGLLLLPAVLSVAVGATVAYWPEFGLAATFGRMADSLAFHMLAAGAVMALVLWSIGARWIGLGLLVAAGIGGGLLVRGHLSTALPLDRTATADLRVLWFNLYADNVTPPDRLADALLSSDADLVILGEAEPIRPILDRLIDRYPHRLGCTGETCEIVVLSHHPFAGGSAEMVETSYSDRLATFTLDLPDRGPLDVIAIHMAKPWYHGFHDVDLWFLLDRAKQSSGPLLALGDFNTAPWSRPMRRVTEETGLASLRHPVATWPVGAGPLGVPIDQMLVRDGAKLVSVTPWGDGLGSNHRGLLAGVSLP